MKKKSLRLLSVVMTIMLSTSFLPVLYPAMTAYAETVTGNISIDGDLTDWGAVTGQAVDVGTTGTASVEEWKVAYSQDGSMVYLAYTGLTPGCYYTDFLDRQLLITQDGNTSSVRIGNLQYYGGDYSVAYVNNASNANTVGMYTVEVAIPATHFSSDSYSLALVGVADTSEAIASQEIVTVDGQDYKAEEPDDKEAVYEGIVIDASYDDWDAVTKYPASCPNASHPNCISEAAAVFDGDYVYLYIKEPVGGGAEGAGSHSNGMFVITSDLGRNMVFQLNPDGTVSGVEGVLCENSANEWEIAIPASALPQYQQSIHFGLYQGETFVENITNLQGNDGNVGTFDGIVYDGLFADWDAYPHALIQYATAGTSELLADGEGALYADGDTLFGHVVSPMIAHVSQGGGEMTRAITIRFNEDDNCAFYPRLVAVDENGNIDWAPNLQELDPGKYEFYIASTDAWGTSASIYDLNEHDLLYGRMILDVGGEGNVDEAEFYLDLEMIADKLGLDVSEMKTIQASFAHIGHEWITTSGAPTGAFLGVAICLGVVAYTWRKKRKVRV